MEWIARPWLPLSVFRKFLPLRHQLGVESRFDRSVYIYTIVTNGSSKPLRIVEALQVVLDLACKRMSIFLWSLFRLNILLHGLISRSQTLDGVVRQRSVTNIDRVPLWHMAGDTIVGRAFHKSGRHWQ